MERVKITYDSLTFAILFIAGLVALYAARYVIVTGLIGIGLGVLLLPLLRLFRFKMHLPKGVSAILVLLLIVMVSAVVLGSVYYLVSDQVSSLAKRAPAIIDSINTRMADLFAKYPGLEEQIHRLNFRNAIKEGVMKVVTGFRTFFILISGAVLVLFMSIYTAVDGNYYYSSIVASFKPEKRKKAAEVLEHCASVLRGWFRAQLIDMFIIGIITAVALWLVGIEYWAVFGLLTAVLGIIPYVGIIVVVTTVTLITLASDPSKVPWVLGIYLVTQQLEGNVILPLVLRGKADLPVVPLLIFMIFLGSFLGILGAFIAPPLLAVLRTLYIDLYLPKINQPMAT